MRELRINGNDAGQRLDRFVGKAVPLLPESLLQKYIRLKRIKLNGKGAAWPPGTRCSCISTTSFLKSPGRKTPG